MKENLTFKFAIDTNRFDDGTPRGFRKGDVVLTKEISKDSLREVINHATNRFFIVEADDDTHTLMQIENETDINVDDIQRMFLVLCKHSAPIVYCD